MQKRTCVVHLRFDVHSLVSVNRIHDDGTVNSSWISFGESGIAVGTPLHGGPHAVPVAEIDVVPHSDFVPVINDWGAGEREQQAIQELYAASIILHQWSKPPANAYINFHS